jgi:5-(carboxyamino)imidazole ribonucleotide synthase
MRVGVIGAGQLGRMLALAGYPLALGFRFLDSSADSPGGQIAPIVTGAFDDADCIARLAAGCDVVTYEFENVPVTALARIPTSVPCHPPVEALRVSQDRLYEKELFGRLGIVTPAYRSVETLRELEIAVAAIGLPAMLKTRRLGYDGRGQRCLRRAADLASAFTALGGVPLILEGFVRFDREVSILGARSTTGETRAYPLAENIHGDGILR